MVQKIHFYALGIIVLMIVAGISGFILIQNLNQHKIDLQDLQPQLKESTKPITQIIVVNGSQYSQALGLTLRNLQALVNEQRPNGTMLYIMENGNDMPVLHEIYGNMPNLTISQVSFSSNALANLAGLINYFKSLVKGFVIFNATNWIYYPAVVNFVANYKNSLAIPYGYMSLLPTNYQFLEMYNFINKTPTTTTKDISDYYSNQIQSFSNTLQGTNIWNYTSDEENYFDFVINQGYFTFPAQLFNGSFPVIEKKILDMTNAFYSKPILNEWPTSIPRLSVPLFKNISGINNLSVYSASILTHLSTKETFQEQFYGNTTYGTNQIQKNSKTTFNYSLIINPAQQSIPFVLNVMIPILATDPNFFNNITVVLNDATFMLLPELYQWLFAQHPLIHFIPKVTIGSIIEPVYFPQQFMNATGFIQLDTTQVLRNDWNSSDYVQLLQKHFIGFYSSNITKIASIFDVNMKNPSLSFSMSDNITEPSLLTTLQTILQNGTNHNFVMAFSGENQFLLSSILSFRLAIQHLASETTDSFMGVAPNLLFNQLT